jgi:hypothetical protein
MRIDFSKDNNYTDAVNKLKDLLHGLDDRGLVLSLAAFAEDALGFLLKSYLLDSPVSLKLIEGFNAPLGTFSSRINAAYALRLITKDQFNDLEKLRKIRNEFAHNWQPLNFSDSKISNLIKGMNYSGIEGRFPETQSEKIQRLFFCLLIEISVIASRMEKEKVRDKVIGGHIIIGFAGDLDQQIKSARNELKEIIENVENSSGEKLEFYLKKLFNFKNRLDFIPSPKSTNQKRDLSELHLEVERSVSQYS